MVLVAGEGTRLRPHTLARPKCLLDVGGRALLDRMLDALGAAGVRRVALVTGYREEQIRAHVAGRRGLDVRFVRNDAWATTNNIVSVHVARDAAPAGVLLLDGDLLFEPRVLDAILGVPDDAALLCHRVPLDDEQMKVRLGPDGRVVAIGKHLPPGDCFGESVGVARFSATGARRLFAAIDAFVRAGETSVWYESAFQKLMDQGLRFAVADATGLRCMEVDTPADLEAARRLAVELS